MRSDHVFLIIFLVICSSAAAYGFGISNNDGPIAKTAQGYIKGKLMLSRRGQKYAAFLAIPFAKAPIGSLRLMPPVEADKWEGTRDGTVDAPSCVQQLPKLKNGTILGTEDCLYANVYTPLRYRSILSKQYPVMVWIYGGGFMIGSATSQDFSPAYLMDKDVVIVTFNYRLGNFGFLSLEDNVIAGNYGLKDQRQALRWVKKYISGYNGNPEEVTIFGQSAGGVSTALHVISPLSRGLFKRAISQSGTALSFWSVSHPGEVKNYATRFIKEVKCNRANSKEILNCLQALPVDKFLFNVINTIGIVLRTLPFDMRIVREPPDAQEPFLTGNPWDEIKKPNDVAWILGVNSADGNLIAEAMYSTPQIVVDVFRSIFGVTLPRLLGYYDTVDPKEHGEVTKKIIDFYFRTPEKKSKRQFINIYTDRVFIQPAIDSIRNYPGICYFYYYDHVNRQSKMYNGSSFVGATHSDELYSLFHFPTENGPMVSGLDETVSDQIIDYWTTFATYGNPNKMFGNLTHWSLASDAEANIRYLYIQNGVLQMRQNLRKEAYELWNSLPIAKDF